MHFPIHHCTAMAVALLVGLAPGNDLPAFDPDLPQPFDAGATQDLLAHSPFTRSVNLTDSLRLTGIAYVDGRPIATFLNTETKQSFTVSDEPNAQGWRLMEASPGAELHDTEVTLQVGPEEVVMHYGDAQLSPGAAKKGMPTSHVAGSKAESKKARDDGEVRIKPSSLLGENGKELYVALSSEARARFRDILKSKLEKQPELTTEQRSAYALKVYASVKAADLKSGGDSGKTGKSSKKSKLD